LRRQTARFRKRALQQRRLLFNIEVSAARAQPPQKWFGAGKSDYATRTASEGVPLDAHRKKRPQSTESTKRASCQAQRGSKPLRYKRPRTDPAPGRNWVRRSFADG